MRRFKLDNIQRHPDGEHSHDDPQTLKLKAQETAINQMLF